MDQGPGLTRNVGMTTTNPRDLQVGSSYPSHEGARSLAAALQDAGIPCAVHQFPEFQGNWWVVCVNRKNQLGTAQPLVRMYEAGARAALSQA